MKWETFNPLSSLNRTTVVMDEMLLLLDKRKIIYVWLFTSIPEWHRNLKGSLLSSEVQVNLRDKN